MVGGSNKDMKRLDCTYNGRQIVKVGPPVPATFGNTGISVF